jgi:hypothetical protein
VLVRSSDILLSSGLFNGFAYVARAKAGHNLTQL